MAIAILRYSAAGLAFAHEKKIVHRDIKGANILVDKDGRVMVSDFGIARALEEVSLTASGMVIGTPYYMSPEQCGGQKISPQSDQYSLGILGFQMLTGEVPFNADSMVGVIQHHYMTPVPDIRAFLGSPYGLVADVKMLDFFRQMGRVTAVVLAILVVAWVGAGLGHEPHRLIAVLLCVAYPCHLVSAHVHHQATDCFQQFDFVGRPSDRLVASA